jgi:hypothetical protein
MTVEELIEELQKLNPELEVRIQEAGSTFTVELDHEDIEVDDASVTFVL